MIRATVVVDAAVITVAKGSTTLAINAALFKGSKNEDSVHNTRKQNVECNSIR